MRSITIIGLTGLVAGMLAAPPVDAQGRGRIDLAQSADTCNTDLADDELDEQDIPDDEAPCALTATVRDGRGRPMRGAQVRLFRGEEESVDEGEPIDTSEYDPFARTRSTGQSGRATFTFHSPDDDTCYQVRAREQGLKSNVLCISSDGTTSTDLSGNETTVTE